jgi:hypothetical protein
MMSMFNACSARPNWVMPIAAKRARMIDPEHPVFVAVEGDRLAPRFEVGASRVEIGKGRFALDKLQVHQSTRRIINEHEQRALRTAILKPPVLTAIDLHKLAQRSRAGSGADGCAFAAACDRPTAEPRSSTAAMSHDRA